MKRILFVEDDDMSRDVISIRLQRSGYHLTVAGDSHQALDLLAGGAFDLIILDMSMPGLSGWELARKLRDSAATAAVPILALSAHTMSSDRKRALEAGCNDFDSKPVNLPRLLGKIEALLSPPAEPAA